MCVLKFAIMNLLEIKKVLRLLLYAQKTMVLSRGLQPNYHKFVTLLTNVMIISFQVVTTPITSLILAYDVVLTASKILGRLANIEMALGETSCEPLIPYGHADTLINYLRSVSNYEPNLGVTYNLEEIYQARLSRVSKYIQE